MTLSVIAAGPFAVVHNTYAAASIAAEASLQADIDREDFAALAVELERLDREVNNHRVPMRHSDIFFRVKSDLHLVRMRLGEQRPERRPECRPDHDEFGSKRRGRGGLRMAADDDLDQDSPPVAMPAEP